VSDFFEEDEPVADVVAAFERAEHDETGRAPSREDAAHLSLILLRDGERARLSRHEVLAVEFLVHERLAEIARERTSSDASLLLVIKAADFMGPLIEELGDEEAKALVARVAASDIGAAAFERVAAVVRSVDAVA
jgi:hypothetical protein